MKIVGVKQHGHGERVIQQSCCRFLFFLLWYSLLLNSCCCCSLHGCLQWGGLERVVQLLLLIASNSAPCGWIGRANTIQCCFANKGMFINERIYRYFRCPAFKSCLEVDHPVWMNDAKERPTPHQRILSSSQLHLDYLTRTSLLIEPCFHCKLIVWPVAYKLLKFFNADVLVICRW